MGVEPVERDDGFEGSRFWSFLPAERDDADISDAGASAVVRPAHCGSSY